VTAPTQADIKAIRNALAKTIRQGLAGTAAKGFNWYPRPIDNPRPPYGIVQAAANRYIVFHETFAGRGVKVVNLRIDLASAARTEDAMSILDELVSYTPTSSASIVNVLAADPTLGGVVSSLALGEAIGPQPGVSTADAALLITIQP
jgi:hypothetical protein